MARGALAFYFMFYILMTVPLVVVYTIDEKIDETLSETDRYTQNWMRVECTFLICVTFFYGITLAILTKIGHRHIDTSLPCTLTLILLIKIIYYCWAFTGGAHYFQYVQYLEHSDIQTMNTTL